MARYKKSSEPPAEVPPIPNRATGIRSMPCEACQELYLAWPLDQGRSSRWLTFLALCPSEHEVQHSKAYVPSILPEKPSHMCSCQGCHFLSLLRFA